MLCYGMYHACMYDILLSPNPHLNPRQNSPLARVVCPSMDMYDHILCMYIERVRVKYI